MRGRPGQAERRRGRRGLEGWRGARGSGRGEIGAKTSHAGGQRSTRVWAGAARGAREVERSSGYPVDSCGQDLSAGADGRGGALAIARQPRPDDRNEAQRSQSETHARAGRRPGDGGRRRGRAGSSGGGEARFRRERARGRGDARATRDRPARAGRGSGGVAQQRARGGGQPRRSEPVRRWYLRVHRWKESLNQREPARRASGGESRREPAGRGERERGEAPRGEEARGRRKIPG